MPRIRKGRGQADLRRGKAGTSPQHRTKSFIRHMAEPRISDNRALKVVGAYPGRPAASPWGIHPYNLPEYWEKPVEKIPGMCGRRIPVTHEPDPYGEGTQTMGGEGEYPNRVSKPEGTLAT